MCKASKARRGASSVEFGILGPAAVMLLLCPVIGGLGVFRYQQVASLARESSRWASVRGTGYQQDTGHTAATALDVCNHVIAAEAVGLDLTQLSYSVTWNTDNRPYHTAIVNGNVVAITNRVSVTVTYQWVPEAFLGGLTLTSTSESAVAN